MRKNTTTVLIGLAVLIISAVSPIVLGKGYMPWAPAKQETISGQVSCQSGRAVVGVWVAQVTNVGEFADWSPATADQSRVVYRATIPADVAYQLHVGCGGTQQTWLMTAYSNTTNAISLTLRCHDIEGDPAYGTCS